MEDYTHLDVAKAFSEINILTRRRIFVDQRSYLIGVLAYKFGLSEKAISTMVNCTRHKVNYYKRMVLQLHADPSYLVNIDKYSQMFPFDFSNIKVKNKHDIKRSKQVILELNGTIHKKLKSAGSILGHKDIRTTINHFLDKSLKLWEE